MSFLTRSIMAGGEGAEAGGDQRDHDLGPEGHQQRDLRRLRGAAGEEVEPADADGVGAAAAHGDRERPEEHHAADEEQHEAEDSVAERDGA